MANVLSTTNGSTVLFPPELMNKTIDLVRGKSSLAKLAGTMPVAFNGNTAFTFNLDKEVDFVDENGAKSNGGGSVGSINVKPVKMEYGLRVSKEFQYGSAEVRLPYLRMFAEGVAKKIARGLDIGAFHGVNPRTGAAATTTVGNMNFDHLVTNTATIATPASGAQTDGTSAIEAAIALIQGGNEDATGIVMSPAFRSILAQETYSDGRPKYPDLSFGGQPNTIGGLQMDSNDTVSFTAGSMTNLNRAYVGNFRDYFSWGYARALELEVIPYGNPDNDATAGDLAGHNQVYLRGEAFIGWAILVPGAFARVLAAS